LKTSLDRSMLKEKGRLCVHAGASPLELRNFAVKVQAPVGKFNKQTFAQQEKARADRVKTKIKRAKVGYFKEKKSKKLQKELAQKAQETRQAELESKETEAKEIQKAKDEKAKKEYQVKCAERKVKQEAEHATNKKLKRVVEAHQKNVAKKEEVDAKIKKGEENVAQLSQAIKDSKKTIAESDTNLASARANASVAYAKAKNSLSIAKGHTAAAKAAAPTLKGSMTSEQDEYDRAEARVKEIHEATANAIKVFHQSQIQLNDQVRSLKELKARQNNLVNEVAASGELVESVGKEKGDLSEEKRRIKKEQQEKKKAAVEKLAQADKKPDPETFDTLLTKLKKSGNPDNAFDLMEKLNDKAKDGLLSVQTDAAAAREEMEMANAQAKLHKWASQAADLANDPSPEVQAAEEKLVQARKSGNLAAIQAAQEELSKLMSTSTQGLAKLKGAQGALEAAKASGDKEKIQAAENMLNTEQEAMRDPHSLAAKVAELKTALQQAKKECNYDPKDEKVIALEVELKTAQKAFAAEQNGRQVDMMIKQAQEAPTGGSIAAEPTVEKKGSEENSNAQVVAAEAELQKAKDKDDKKRVEELQGKITELKQEAAKRSGNPAL